ncbi:MAG: hypothetical protein GX039_06825, partial [Clostridia bacterium]|nr:hypothetical protein [Clostridia bacterium]
KWTAYDMLLELEKQGFLERRYVVNSNEKIPGRSLLKFVPTLRADSISKEGKEEDSVNADWQHARGKLLKTLSNLLPREANKVVGKLLAEIPGKEQPVINCAYVLTILLVLLKVLEEKAIQLLQHALQKVPRPEIGLFLVAGTGFGLLANPASQASVSSQLSAYVSNLQDQITTLSGGEHKLLLEFIHEALDKIINK